MNGSIIFLAVFSTFVVISLIIYIVYMVLTPIGNNDSLY